MASTSSAIHQGGSSASVALASHLESISSVVGGLLTQESATSGWYPMVHKVKPFFLVKDNVL